MQVTHLELICMFLWFEQLCLKTAAQPEKKAFPSCHDESWYQLKRGLQA